jgi:hypothetical protein
VERVSVLIIALVKQEARLRAKGGPDSSADDDNNLGETFVSAQEIHDQRTKLSVASSRSDSRKPGARPVESDRNAKDLVIV